MPVNAGDEQCPSDHKVCVSSNNTNTTLLKKGSCEDWCKTHQDKWAQKCTFKKCTGCSPCAGLPGDNNKPGNNTNNKPGGNNKPGNNTNNKPGGNNKSGGNNKPGSNKPGSNTSNKPGGNHGGNNAPGNNTNNATGGNKRRGASGMCNVSQWNESSLPLCNGTSGVELCTGPGRVMHLTNVGAVCVPPIGQQGGNHTPQCQQLSHPNQGNGACGVCTVENSTLCWTGYPNQKKTNQKKTNMTSNGTKCKCACAKVKAVIKIKGITEDQFATKAHMNAFLETVAKEVGGATQADDVKITCAKKACRIKVSSKRRATDSVEVEFTVDAEDSDAAALMGDNLIDRIDDSSFATEFSLLAGIPDVEAELTYGPVTEDQDTEESSEDNDLAAGILILIIAAILVCCCLSACVLMYCIKSAKGQPESFTELSEPDEPPTNQRLNQSSKGLQPTPADKQFH